MAQYMKLPLDFTKQTYKFSVTNEGDLDEYVPYEIRQLPGYNKRIKDQVLFHNLTDADFGTEIQKYWRNILDEKGELVDWTIWTENEKPTEGLKELNQAYGILYEKTYKIANPIIKNLRKLDFQKKKEYLE